MPRVSVVVSGDFYRFKLALPSLLSLLTWCVTRDAFMNSSLAFSRRELGPPVGKHVIV